MFGSVVLDVAIGLAFVYALLSLICSALREGIEARLKSRARHLERGIREMLGDRDGSALASRLYGHPLVSSLFAGQYADRATSASSAGPKPEAASSGATWLADTARSWKPGEQVATNLPSYIPARNFALALLDLAGRGDAGAAPAGATKALSIEAIRESVHGLGNANVQRVVLTALDTARGDLDTAIRNVQAWYDSGMDRVSGWYKRETQHILFWLGLALTVLFNVNSIAIVKHLATSEQARETLVFEASRAAAAAASPTPSASGPLAASADADARFAALRERLQGLNLPIGWSEFTFDSRGLASAIFAIPGWLITAFAITFGAPFWFDLLNKMMVIRSTVKPREKSPEEGSEDRLPQRAAAQPPGKS